MFKRLTSDAEPVAENQKCQAQQHSRCAENDADPPHGTGAGKTTVFIKTTSSSPSNYTRDGGLRHSSECLAQTFAVV